MTAAIEKLGIASPPFAPAVEKLLNESLARRDEIEAEIASLSLDEAIGAAGAAERISRLEKELASVQALVKRRTAGHRAAASRTGATTLWGCARSSGGSLPNVRAMHGIGLTPRARSMPLSRG